MVTKCQPSEQFRKLTSTTIWGRANTNQHQSSERLRRLAFASSITGGKNSNEFQPSGRLKQASYLAKVLVKTIIQKTLSSKRLFWRRSLPYHCENEADLQDGIDGLGNQNNTKITGSGLGEEGKGPKSPRHDGVERGARPHECGGMPQPSRHPITPKGLDSLHDTSLNDSNWKTWD